jgi:hypothetical protein
MLQLYSCVCGWKSEVGSIKAPATPSPSGESRPNNALHRTLDSAAELWRSALSRLMQRQVLMKRRILALLLVAIQSRGFGDFDP